MAKTKIHGFAGSTYTRSARMAAIEKGVVYDLVALKYGEPEHFALHPFGKMPILTDAAATVFETLAILDHLDTTPGPVRLFGASPEDRRAILTAASAAIDYGYPALVKIDLAETGPDEAQRTAAALVLDWLEARLGASRHLAGQDLSAADLFFVPMLAYHLAKVDAAALDGRPKLAAWLAALRARPSFRDTGEP